jgi:hypothetical protein
MTFARRTSNITGRSGTTSTGPSSLMDNQLACKSESQRFYFTPLPLPEGESGTKSRAQRNRILSWTWSAGVAQVPPDSISRFCVGAAGAISVQLNWTRNPIFRGW